MEAKIVAAIAAFLAVLVISVMAALALVSKAESDTAQACINAGKEWVHVRGSIYECRTP